MKWLGVDYILFYYFYCCDYEVLIEDVIGFMVELVVEGKIGGIGFFEIFLVMFEWVSVVYLIMVV